jgi:holo-[acyl-carrier protein] synthase
MSVRGLGIDILDIDTAHRLFSSEGILKRTFTEREISKVEGKVDRIQRLAGWFCAKEAVIKALKIPRESGIVLNMIEINHGENGDPSCACVGWLKEKVGDGNIIISISQSEKSAVGMAIFQD